MKLGILGGGLAAVSLAHFLQEKDNIDEIFIIEKEDSLGGLCRSFETNGIFYDVGPHIIFSKDTEILDFMNNLLGENLNEIKRSNRILHKQRFVQYPFENDLSKLPEDDLEYCVNAFMNNPYENYNAENMLQFFLKTFGEGITNLYLRPYNEKIWKYDPSFMDIQMVERIPKPPKEDILRSAKGETIEGYTHQSYFTYPKTGGIEEIIKSFSKNFNSKVKIFTENQINSVKKENNKFMVSTQNKEFCFDKFDKIVSTIPADLFVNSYQNKPQEVAEAAQNLKYNSIIIAIVNVNIDKAGDNFAFMIADKNVKFHRLSKLDFMGENYHKHDSATYMLEITYRKNDLTDLKDDKTVLEETVAGLIDIGFIESKNDVNFSDIKRFEYAYVIYDLNHRKNMDIIKKFFQSENVALNGRFGEFEYLNMDAVIRRSLELAKRL